MLDHDIKEILFTEDTLHARVKELADQINHDYEGKDVIIVGILRGSFIFMADLLRCITLPCRVDFMSVSSYGKGTVSSGKLKISKDMAEDVTNAHVIVVEDIVDSGFTLSNLLKLLKSRGPASVRLCTLLNKPDRRTVDVHIDYTGFTIPDAFVVGYGLDYAEKYRNLPYIGILKPEVYEK